jgi:hypothetical protein
VNPDKQGKLIAEALLAADPSVRRDALSGTIGDTQAFCWGALRQFDRRSEQIHASSPLQHGLSHSDLHLLLIIAHEAVSHVERIEELLASIGVSQSLSPDEALRTRLREARNLLAEHRDERILYWRLTGNHTPRVVAAYERLGIMLPKDSIDSEVIGYSPPCGSSDAEVETGYATIGTVGGLLSLPDLQAALRQLSLELEELVGLHAV